MDRLKEHATHLVWRVLWAFDRYGEVLLSCKSFTAEDAEKQSQRAQRTAIWKSTTKVGFPSSVVLFVLCVLCGCFSSLRPLR
jgi:hypothetical protein